MSGFFAAKTGRDATPALARKQASAGAMAPPEIIPDRGGGGRASQRKSVAAQITPPRRQQEFTRRNVDNTHRGRGHPQASPQLRTDIPRAIKSFDGGHERKVQPRTPRMVASRSQTISVTERPQAENGIRFPWKWEQGKIVFTGPAKAARKRELLPVGRKGGRRVHVAASSSSSSDEDERETGIRPAPLYPSNDLLDALKYHYLHFFILKRSHRLPYLSRNLRIGFKAYCSRNGITVAPETRSGDPVRLLIRLVEPASSDSEDPDDGNVSRYQAKLMRWKCPLCDTHGLPGFNNKDMLDAHLSWDHSEVSFKWECNENFVDCQLTLSVPDVSDEKTSVGSPSRSPSPEEALATATVEEGIDPSQVSDTRLPHETAEAPMSSSTVKVEWDEPSGSSTIPTLSSQSSSTAPTMSRFATPIRIERETPHPTADPLPSFDIPAPPMGPTAQYPYLPADAYSCRPGGPRLFDLLPPLSRDLYGVMVWAVIDKEEELFELDDVRDEDKVIQALWNRWILLGRKQFIKSYFKGTMAFVEQNYKTIQLAAGWMALRAWLQVLAGNGFLTCAHMAEVLQHYEILAGMR